MQIWPAIDLRGGRCVRLAQGDFQRETVYDADPAAVARRFVEEGARCLHLVDLDGARDGRPANLAAVRSILATVDAKCELGGGIRDEETIAELLQLGLDRLVIGTLALKEPAWFRQVSRKFPGRLVLGIDARDGMVATDGWLSTSQTPAIQLAVELSDAPIAAIIYTDINTDGMLVGPNVAAMAEMQRAVDVPVVASGGISRVEDVVALAEIPVAGCIIGKALYEGRITIGAALAAASAAGAGPLSCHDPAATQED